MHRLLAAVVLVDETSHGIEIMRVHGRRQSVNHLGHQALPQPPVMASTCLVMIPAVAQALRRLAAAAMAYPSRPCNAAHCHMRARRTGAPEADVNINLPTTHDKSRCLGSIHTR